MTMRPFRFGFGFLHTMSRAFRILHSYKVYRPDLDGGIPFVMATLSKAPTSGTHNEILVARLRGMARKFELDGVTVRAVCSLGNLFSMPVAPTYPFALIARAKLNDLLVHHAPFPMVDIAAAFLPHEKPLIVFWHADIVGRGFLRKVLSPWIMRTLTRAKRIVVADQSTIDGSPFLRTLASRCVIVPYGIDVEHWATCSQQELKQADRLRQRHPRMIVAIGRLVSYKGYDVLIEALKQIDGHLVLVGDGPLRGDLQRIAAQAGVADRITFTGRLDVSDTKAHLHAARVFAFPSVTRAEAFGIAQLEAMAAGLPVVNTSLTTAVPHIARHDLEGLTVRPHDPKGLAAALNRILDDSNLADRLGKAAKARARSEYSEQRFVKRMEDVYRSVLQNSQPRHEK